MATPTSTIINIAVANVANYPATLVSSSYEGAPLTVPVDTRSIRFTQDITSENLLGAFVYDINNTIKWITLWTSDKKVCSKIIKADAPIVWKDILDSLELNESTYKFDLDDGHFYVSTADIFTDSDGSENLIANMFYDMLKAAN